jgi:hypothetical protein
VLGRPLPLRVSPISAAVNTSFPYPSNKITMETLKAAAVGLLWAVLFWAFAVAVLSL